nr:MarC family protein [Campylobacter sp. MIT 19-121]
MFLISITILAVLNPFGNLTQFLTMTGELATPIRQKLFRNILYTAFIIVMVFLFSGAFIMRYVFSVSLDDLRIAGGLILIIMAIKNLLFAAKKQELLHYQGLDEKGLLAASVVPMAFPMLVGPGTLSTAIVASEDSGLLIACGAVVFAFAFMFLLFHFAATIERIIGKLILHVFSRIAQVFIMAIGIKMMIIGIKDIFHL